jgi:hypothetical protein
VPPSSRPREPGDLERARREFDFWLGEWDLIWEPDGRGRNRIASLYEGRVIVEEFDGAPSMNLRGMSVSTNSPETGLWHQTWVDSQGSYLDFRGAFRDGEMILERSGMVDGQEVRQRMVWRDIEPERLTWRWERSNDDGLTWRTLWEIAYRRRSEATG